MNKAQSEKNQLRIHIKSLKEQYSQQDLAALSQDVIEVLEITGVFQNSQNVFIYNSLAGEVQTSGLINKWKDRKIFFLPVVKGNDIVFRKYDTDESLKLSSYGIMEPLGDDFTEYNKIDLIIVPGVAFDRKKNRLGHGKGYYDRFFKKINAPKIGICFEFQLFDQIPAGEHDIKMDYVISENDLIW